MDDLSLIASALAGDDSAFEGLIPQFSRRLYAVAFGVLQNPAEAEEVVQDTFLRAWRDRRTIRPPEKLPGWLVVTTRNRALDLVRKRRHAPMPESEIPDNTSQPADAKLDEHFRATAVHRALSSLPDHYRIALSLRYLEGMDCRSIEAAMGVTSGALRGILARALERLRTKPELQES